MSVDQIEEDHYATAANFGGDVYVQEAEKSPYVKKVTVPESIKRRVPSKHYVYKVVIEWSNNNTVIIYRRYTHFFDFLVKLQQLVSSLIQQKIIEGPVNLPELPGRVLFGRSEVHQVAEKRRSKIEEFCQQLIQLPPEISESNLVLGFFNTWPDDTLLLKRHSSWQPIISNPVLTSPPPKHLSQSPPSVTSPPPSAESSTPPPGRPTSSVDSSLPSSVVLSPSYNSSSSTTSSRPHSDQAIDSVISHPDEMESLEQYRVLDDYERKDSHQVNLHAGQIVHVIEKHDTGWWMVMSEDEQGYAPAVYLEPMENNAEKDVHPEDSIDEVYEAMESFAPENEDEVGFSAGERLHVISKSMDGWWKIRRNGKVGFSPAALIRRKLSTSTHVTKSGNFESEKFIYEEMNIHRPPPRRNTLDRTLINKVTPTPQHPPPGYLSPKSNAALASHFDSDVYVDPAEEIYALPPDYDEEELYTVPPEFDDNDINPPNYSVPRPLGQLPNGVNGDVTHKRNSQEGSDGETSPTKSINGGKFEMRAAPAGMKTNAASTMNSVTNTSSSSIADKSALHSQPIASSGTPAKPSIYDDTVFENDSSKQTDDNSATVDDDAVYENTDFDHVEAPKQQQQPQPPQQLLKRAPIATRLVQSPTRHKPKKHTPDDYEDLEYFEGKSPTELIPAMDDYVDMDSNEDNMYVATEELQQRRGSDFNDTPVASPRLPISPASTAPVLQGPPPPPLPAARVIKPILSKSMSMDVIEHPITEEEYVEMDVVYPKQDIPVKQEKPVNASDKSESTGTPHDQSKTKSKPARPSPPPRVEHKKLPSKSQSSHNVLSRILKKKSPLVRAKSLENILSSSQSKDDYAEISREGSPTFDHEPETFKPTPPPLPPPRIPGVKRQSTIETIDGLKVGMLPKPKPAYYKTANPQKPLVNGHAQSGSRRSESPPSRRSPTSPSESQKHESSLDNGVRREHVLSKMIEKMQRRYIAVHSYTAPKEGCLSFSAGETCTVKQKKSDGWWLVRVGEREGWTPGNYWKEEGRPSASPASSVPQKPPEVVRKPRSHTVATDNVASSSEPTSSPEFTSPREEALRSTRFSLSLDGEKSHQSPGMDAVRPLPPSRPPPVNRPKLNKGPPPPRPKPFASTTQTSGPVKKPKPALPQKPTGAARLAARTSPSPNTPPERRKRKSASPPPLPPPNPTRKFIPGDIGIDVAPGQGNDEEYVMLKDATTILEDIQTAPWFSGKMDRVQAEQFLMEYGRQREFLVRERTAKDGFYALSIRYHYSCKHFNIDPTSDGQYSMGTLTFPSIQEIIQHYQQNSLFIHDGHHVTLGQPAKKKTRGSDASKYNPVH